MNVLIPGFVKIKASKMPFVQVKKYTPPRKTLRSLPSLFSFLTLRPLEKKRRKKRVIITNEVEKCPIGTKLDP